MSNTSKKYRNKRIRNISLGALIVIIIGSFIVSRNANKVDPSAIENVETFPIAEHIKGNVDSGLMLIEYSDFQCPACAQTYPIVKQMIEQYGDQFAVEYRHFPLRQIHPNAQIAAQAAEAAGIQGKFWEMHDMLFEQRDEWTESFNPKRYFTNYAEKIGINPDRFVHDLESSDVKDRVNGDYDEAMGLNLPGTPSFVLNGERIDFEDFVNNYLNFTGLEVSQDAESVDE